MSSKPDAWLQIIKDSARTDKEIRYLFINLMNLLNNQPLNIIFQTIENVDSTFGKRDEILHGYTLLFKAKGYLSVHQADTAITFAQNSFSVGKN